MKQDITKQVSPCNGHLKGLKRSEKGGGRVVSFGGYGVLYTTTSTLQLLYSYSTVNITVTGIPRQKTHRNG